MSEQTIIQRIEKLEERATATEQNLKNLGGNLKFLRDLVEECVHLTEQSSGIVVEHVTTLDSRLNSVGELFADKIKNRLTAMVEGLDEMEKKMLTEGLIEKEAEETTAE